MSGPFESPQSSAPGLVGAPPPRRRIGAWTAVAAAVFCLPVLAVAWVLAVLALRPGHPLAAALAAVHCAAGLNAIPLLLLGSLIGLGWTAVRRRRRAAAAAVAPPTGPVSGRWRWRAVLAYGRLIAIVSFTASLGRTADLASRVSCAASGRTVADVAHTVGASTSEQLIFVIMFAVGGVTARWAASILAGKRSSFAAVSSVLAHAIAALFVALAALGARGLVPR